MAITSGICNVTRPLFSVLIPSKDRPDLLSRALDSIRRQEFADVEIVVADNASSPPYELFAETLGDERIQQVRTEVGVPVTENWNRALAQARGEYAVMLGDDDALAPGYFVSMTALIEQFSRPSVVYCGAYHYAYPGVMPSEPDGVLAIVRNSPLFVDHYEPYELPLDRAAEFAKKALNFHDYFPFNSQHFLWKRSAMPEICRGGDFFKSPYPDFYSAIMTFLNAKEIVVQPLPRVIIGISPRSFGYYYLNRQEHEGHQYLGAEGQPADAALLPGSEHNTKWLLAADAVRSSMSDRLPLHVGTRNYRRLQIVAGARRKVLEGDEQPLQDLQRHLRLHEKLFVWGMETGTQLLRSRRPNSTGTFLFRAVDHLLDQHAPSVNTRLPLRNHATILDAIRWLEVGSPTPASDPPNPFLSPNQQGLVNQFHDLYYSLMSEGKGVQTIGLKWLGVDLFKCPLDLWIYQEWIHAHRPDVIIETGTFRGGSAHYLATLCELVGHGRVITVDVSAWEDVPRPQHPRLTYITGSSIAAEVLAELRRLVGKATNVLVILDSDHTRDHVLDELRLYQQFIPPGGLLVVEDTNVNGHPTYPEHGPGPWEAVDAFLAENPDFIADRSMERFLLTMNPRGFLRRTSGKL
ncbi:MAG TPA: CmcI family methyltransferase [Actinomycetota bacterium]|nr:CmcI family methyltransferase [Actinomycetota bacterium]